MFIPLMQSRTYVSIGVIACAMLLSAIAAHAGAVSLSTMDVVSLADKNNSDFGDYQVQATMKLYDPRGSSSERDMRITVLEVPDDGDKSLTLFQSPADQKGVALLSHSHRLDDDDQFLYLPAIRRVKRIASKNKSGPFVGSEFAFEDIIPQEISKFTYGEVAIRPCGESQCYYIERAPVDKNSGYTSLRTWYHPQHFGVVKIDFIDRKQSLLKTLTVDDYRDYDGKWRAHVFTMENHQTGSKTELDFDAYHFDAGLTESDFSKTALKRIR